MAEWDKKFARIVAETERHLASVKKQLDSQPSSSSSRSSGVTKRTPKTKRSGLTSPYLTKSQSTPLSILRSPGGKIPSPALSSLLASSSAVKRNVSFEYSPSTTSSSSLPSSSLPSSSLPTSSFNFLNEKLKDQQKDLIAVRESLNGVQFYLKQQHGQIMSLKDDMHVLQLKMSESELSFRTNKKLQQFKQEVMSEIEALERKVRSLSVRGVASHVTGTKMSSLSDELLTSKLKRNEEVISLRREISNLKSKLVTQESKVVGVASSLREARKCQEQTNTMLSEAKMRWSVDSRSQLQEIRALMSSLTTRLSSVEEAVFMSTNRSTPIPSHDRSHTHFKTSKPMTIRDLNISPISSTMATKPHPLFGGEGSSSNPLYSVPGEGACATEGRDREESDLGSHTLSGHTLSCSLELMSDLDVSDNSNSDLISETASLSSLTV